MEDKRIIEINGIKMEVDLRQAKVVENYKVGDYVKILVKEYNGYKSYIGNIIGFDDFQKTPSVVIAYLKTEYNAASIAFINYNSLSEDFEMTTLNEWDIPLQKSTILEQFQKEILKKEQEVIEMKTKADMFERLFGKYFEGK
jgi:ribosome-associated toxin RatA of RatAB toxin-antitoxin module